MPTCVVDIYILPPKESCFKSSETYEYVGRRGLGGLYESLVGQTILSLGGQTVLRFEWTDYTEVWLDRLYRT
jgi:hypothetical protein